MHAPAPALTWVDLMFLGRPHTIATAMLRSADSVALVDPGPSTCLTALGRGLGVHGLQLSDVTHLLLTHIHLDHAGAAGSIVRRYPDISVVVHERGAPHLVDPAKLLASARRLYGNRMDELWGEFVAVPQGNMTIVSGGEQITAGGRTLDVAYTPGHASHHVSYFDRSTGVAYVGDTGGVCVDGGYILPPTPPPDIDISAWHQSVARIQAWSPHTLFMTHFGPVGSPGTHLQTLMTNLDTMAELVRVRMQEGGSEEDQRIRFAADLDRELRPSMTDEQRAAYWAAAPPELLWLGLERYWRKLGS